MVDIGPQSPVVVPAAAEVLVALLGEMGPRCVKVNAQVIRPGAWIEATLQVARWLEVSYHTTTFSSAVFVARTS